MVTKGAYKIYESQSNLLSIERILRYIDILSDAVLSQKYANNPRLCAEVAITGILKRPDITDPQGILERLLELENKVKNFSTFSTHSMATTDVKKEIPKTIEPKAEAPVDVKANIAEETVLLEPKKKDVIKPQIEEYLQPDTQSEEYIGQEPQFDERVPQEPPIEEAYFSPDTVVEEEFETPCETDYPIPAITDEDSTSNLSTDEKGISNVSADLENSWDDIVAIAIKNADFGFKKIINDVKVVFKENAIEIVFENETFFGISKMNKYDEIIKKSAKSVTGKDILVRIHTNKEEDVPKDSNYDYLMKKLDTYGDNISFI
jgi:hypothetical protein